MTKDIIHHHLHHIKILIVIGVLGAVYGVGIGVSSAIWNWSSFICSLQEQFYLFRRISNETILSFPTHIKRRSSICSTGIVLKLF